MWRMDIQRDRYGAHLFVKDEEGKYTCFFKGCGQSYRANFSRHIEQHERKGEKLDDKFVRKQYERYKDHPDVVNSRFKSRIEKYRSQFPLFKCREILESIKKVKSSSIFAEPVDHEGLGLKDYLDVIKKPMDLGTIETKLDNSDYQSNEEFADDMRLVWKNAMTYNAPDSEIHEVAAELSRLFESKMSAVELETQYDKLESNTKDRYPGLFLSLKKCAEIIDTLYDEPKAEPFRMPVDHVRLGLKDYLRIVKQPMDLNSVKERLSTGKYKTHEEFARDVRLVWKNAQLYNGPDSEIGVQAKQMSDTFEEMLDQAFQEVETFNARMRGGRPYCYEERGRIYFWDFDTDQYYCEYVGDEPMDEEPEELDEASNSETGQRGDEASDHDEVTSTVEHSNGATQEQKFWDPYWCCYRTIEKPVEPVFAEPTARPTKRRRIQTNDD